MVEEKTAAKLNEALRAIGAFDEKALVVRGTVTSSGGGAATGATVGAREGERTNKRVRTGAPGGFHVEDRCANQGR